MSVIEFGPSTGLVVLLVLPFVFQACTMMIDEFHFHRERGLPRWERIGHPLDTLTVVLFYGFLLTSPPSQQVLPVLIGLGLFSMIFTAKDEPIHARLCCRKEHWTHIVLFALHPLVLLSAGYLWWIQVPSSRVVLQLQGGLTTLFMVHQIVYWNFMPSRRDSEHADGAVRDQ